MHFLKKIKILSKGISFQNTIKIKYTTGLLLERKEGFLSMKI
jgi:hypothetical protein